MIPRSTRTPITPRQPMAKRRPPEDFFGGCVAVAGPDPHPGCCWPVGGPWGCPGGWPHPGPGCPSGGGCWPPGPQPSDGRSGGCCDIPLPPCVGGRVHVVETFRASSRLQVGCRSITRQGNLNECAVPCNGSNCRMLAPTKTTTHYHNIISATVCIRSVEGGRVANGAAPSQAAATRLPASRAWRAHCRRAPTWRGT